MKNVIELSHPLIKHKLTLMRKKETGTAEFRILVRELAIMIGYEALRDLSLEDVEIETPVERCTAPLISG